MFATRFFNKICFLFITLLSTLSIYAQSSNDSIVANHNDTIFSKNDSSFIKKDTILAKDDALKSDVEYGANDSVLFNMVEKKVTLYGQAYLNYENIKLTAGKIIIDLDNNTIFSYCILDSAGNKIELPIFDEGGKTFRSEYISYNFNTKKGYIKNVKSEQDAGFMHGQIIKRMPNDDIHIKNGSFTTCDADCPHFELKFGKAIVKPDDKIITGPAFIAIESIPTFLAIPFAIFPNKKGQRSGLILPFYGNSESRGYFLEGLGYYWGINDNIDLTLKTDIYTRGSYAFKTNSTYVKRYKYTGGFDINFSRTIESEKELADYKNIKDFFIKWNHSQDAKANPNSKFSADINAGTSSYNKNTSGNTSDYLSNTFNSGVSYFRSFSDNKYNMNISIRHTQNTILKTISITAPDFSFNVNRFNPFETKKAVKKNNIMKNFSIYYNLSSRNYIDTYDSLLFSDNTLNNLRNGIKHSIPISHSFNLLKYINITNSISYNQRWYFDHIQKQYTADSASGYIKTDTIRQFSMLHEASFSSSWSTKLYGLVQFPKSYIRAIRHVITPNASLTLSPGYGDDKWGYYKKVQTNPQGDQTTYSLYSNGIYGAPSQYKSGVVNLSISNNLEMKIKSTKDSTKLKKIILIENLTLGTNYDLAKDSLQWSDLYVNGRTKLFERLDLKYSGIWSPYIFDEASKHAINKYEIYENDRLFRYRNGEWALSFAYNLNKKRKKPELQPINFFFEYPFNLSIYYTLMYRTYNENTSNIKNETIQTLSFSGDFKITNNWKITFSSGYDFKNKELTYTSINVYRDLHCWEMMFNIIPFGQRKSYNFTINVKSTMLKDLKLNKKKDWWDS